MGLRLSCTALIAAFLGTTGALPARADALDALIAEARDTCAAMDNGALTIPEGAISRLDLTGNGLDDTVFDTGRLACSTSASLFCGSGGCMTYFVVGDHVTAQLLHAWQLATPWDRPVVLMRVHGSTCGGYGAQPCVNTMIWDDGAFLSPDRP